MNNFIKKIFSKFANSKKESVDKIVDNSDVNLEDVNNIQKEELEVQSENDNVTIDNERYEEAQEFARNIFKTARQDLLKSQRLSFRLSIVAASIAYSIKQLKESDVDECLYDGYIDWDEINDELFTDLDEYDYNIDLQPIQSINQFNEFKLNVEAAEFGLSCWQKYICKDCGEEFYLTISEVQYFKNKNLSLPKRCKSCREYRKKDIKNGK